MSRIYTQGWEEGHMGDWVIESTYKTWVAVVDNDWLFNKSSKFKPIEHGNYALRLGGSRNVGLDLRKLPGVPSSGLREIYIRFRMQCNRPYWSPYVFLRRGQWENLNILRAYYLSGGLQMSSYPDNIQTGAVLDSFQWHTIEWYCLLSTNRATPNGAMELKVNGISATGGLLTNIATTTQAQSDWLIQSIAFYGTGSSSDNYVTLYDDIVICDSTASFTDAYILKGEPSAIGSNHYWEPEPPSQETYECVNSVGDQATVDTDYINAIGTGGRETFPITLDETGVSNVDSVTVRCRGKKAGAASAYQMAPVLRSGGDNYDSPSQDLTTDNEEYVAVWEQNPNTSTDWTTSDLNNIEIGVKADE